MWQTALAEPPEPFFVRMLQENLLDEFFQHSTIFPPCFRRFEAGVLDQVGTLNDLPAENLPILGGGHGQVHVNSVARQVWSVRSDVMVPHPNPCGFFSLVPVMMRKIPEPGNGGLKHRDVDELPASGFLSLIEREKDSHSGIHRGSQIDDGQTD